MTRLKSRILSHFPGKLQEQSDGKTVLLVFNEEMASFHREELWKHDYESDALTLEKAARIVRREMFNQPGFHFHGTFHSNCQISSVPSCLRALISMLLNGSNIAHRSATESQATQTISQLIVFNSKRKSSTTSSNRHSLERDRASNATVRWPEYTRIYQKQGDHKRTLSTGDKRLLRQSR